MQSIFCRACLVAGVVMLAGACSATPLTWNLNNVMFADGAKATGSFVFDADNNAFSGFNMITSGGVALASDTWVINTNDANSTRNTAMSTGIVAIEALRADETGEAAVILATNHGPLTNAGGTIDLTVVLEGQCADATCHFVNTIDLESGPRGSGQFTTAPALATAPEPSTMLMIGVALVFAGLSRRLVRRIRD